MVSHCLSTVSTKEVKLLKTKSKVKRCGASTKIKLYSCHLCSYKTITSSSLKTHQMTHQVTHGVMRFGCDLCEYRTNQRIHLRDHKLTHTSPKPFEGPTTTPSIYKPTQSEEKQYKCDLCDFKTTTILDSIIHIRTHTGQKPYETSTNSQLTVHKRTPSVAKPYCCTKCDFSAAQQGKLRKHIRRTHPVREMSHRWMSQQFMWLINQSCFILNIFFFEIVHKLFYYPTWYISHRATPSSYLTTHTLWSKAMTTVNSRATYWHIQDKNLYMWYVIYVPDVIIGWML